MLLLELLLKLAIIPLNTISIRYIVYGKDSVRLPLTTYTGAIEDELVLPVKDEQELID